MQKTCIIIPCYNEQNRLEANKYVKFIRQNPYYFCFVNDGSTDDTGKVLKEIKKLEPNKVVIVDLPKNVGKGEAIRQGFFQCLNLDDFTYLGFLDADLATPLEEISMLLSHFERGFKVVTGARVKRLGTIIHRNLLRHYLGRIFATISSLTLEIKMYDSQCGAKFFEKETASLLIEKAFVSKWLFDLELIYRLKEHDPHNFNRNIIEVPLETWIEKYNSRLKLTDFLVAPFELFKIRNN